MVGEDIIGFFEAIGPLGLMVAFSLISFLDGFAVPTLPEAWLLLIALTDAGVPKPIWGISLVLVGATSAVAAQIMLYFVVKKVGLPKRLTNIMQKYTKILIVSNERLMIVNWLAPVIPFTGAFIAVCGWNPKKAFMLSWIGGVIKISILVSIAMLFPLFFNAETVADASIVLIIVVLIVSVLISYIRHKRIEKRLQEPQQSVEMK